MMPGPRNNVATVGQSQSLKRPLATFVNILKWLGGSFRPEATPTRAKQVLERI
jgi:hypothetical protein